MDNFLSIITLLVCAVTSTWCTREVVQSVKRGEEIAVESEGWPESIPPYTQQSWIFYSPSGTKINLNCYDIRLFQPNPPVCDIEALTITAGEEVHTICGAVYDFKTTTTGNMLRMELKTGEYESGGVSCFVSLHEPPTQAPPVFVPPPAARPPPEEIEPVVETIKDLVPGGPRVKLQSPSYPESIPPKTNVIWNINTSPGSTIRITCREIRLRPSRTEECSDTEFLKVFNGDRVKALCGGVYNYDELSSGNTLKVQLMSTSGGGGVQCTVQGRVMGEYGEVTTPKYDEVASEEIDSSEHGGPPGRKATTCPCGTANKGGKRIVNGVETAVNEYPFMASIYKKGSDFNFCGGSILTQWHVLTAAHCTWRFQEEGVQLSVVVGHHDQRLVRETETAQRKDVAQIIQHSEFDNLWLTNDIALLVLEEKIEFNKFVSPVCLPPNGWVDLSRQYITVIGFGRLKARGSSSPTLQKVHERVIELESCSRVFTTVSDEVKTQICTFSHNKASCQGDSGGPVIWLDPETNRYTLVGLVSFGRVCADENPSVQTAVAAYVDWIEKHIRETIPQKTCSKVE